MSELNAVPADLRSAAGSIAAVQGTVGQIKSSASTATSLSPQAFGILCSFFTAPCVAMSTQALQSMTEISTVLGKHGPDLEAIADDFEHTDTAVAQRHSNLLGML